MQLTEKGRLLLTHCLEESSRLEKGSSHELILEHEAIPGDLGKLAVAWERSEGKQTAVVFGDR